MQDALLTARNEFQSLTQAAMKAGNAMEGDFKTRIAAAKVGINEMTREINQQKAIVQDATAKVRELGMAYKEALSKGGDAKGLKQSLSEAMSNLEEDKSMLAQLNQKQIEARLSVKELSEEYAALREESDKTSKSTGDMSFSLGKLAAALGGAAALKSFVSQIIQVRGQFQDMETQIETLVGKATTAKIMPDIKEMAKVSPLTMTDIVGAEKMMLSFNIAAEDSVKYLKALSDISMGDSQKFNSLTLAFSQMSSAGKLMGQDLLQMINAGFNPLQEIAKKTGKSISELKEEMSKGAISAQMVQEAFISATSEGGKFFGMSEAASKTIRGQISMMEDAMDAALNNIGIASEGLIMGSIKTITKLIENYETVGRVILTVAATYGTYRAAVLVTTAAEKLAALQRLAQIKHTTALSLATGGLTGKVKALNVALKANPWGIALSAIAAIGGAIWTFTANKREEKKAIQETNKAIGQEVANINTLAAEMKDANTSEARRLEILKELKAINPEIVKGVEDEANAVEQLAKNVELYNTQKLAEMAVNESDERSDYEDAKKAREEAKKEIEKSKNVVINAWTDLKPQIVKAIESGEVSDSLSGWLEEFIYDPNVDMYDKLAKIQEKYQDEYFNKPRWLVNQDDKKAIVGWVRASKDARRDYISATNELAEAEKNFEGAAKDLETRISETVDNLTPKAEDAAQIKLNLGLFMMPEAPKGPVTPEVPLSPNLGKEYDEKEKAWKKAKKKLDDINKARKDYNKAEYDAAVSAEAKARKEFQAVGGDVSSRKGASSTDPILKRMQAEQKDLQAARKIQDINARVRKLILGQIADDREREAELRKFENQQEIERINREKEDYVNALVKAEYEKLKAKGKGATFDEKTTREEVLKRDDVKKYDEIAKQTEQAQDKEYARKKAEKEEADRIAYLKEYGDFKEKVLAITEEYNQKIAKAENEWERKSLEAERDKVLEEMKQAKDASYQNIFKDTSKMSSSTIKEAIKKAQEEIQKTEYKNILSESDIEKIKILQEAIDKLQAALSSKVWESFGDGLSGIADKLSRLSVLRQKNSDGTGWVYNSSDDYEEAKAIGENLKKNIAGVALQEAVSGFDAIGSSLHNIADTLDDANLKAAANALDEIAGSLKTAVEGFAQGGPIFMLLNLALEQIMKPIHLLIEFFESGAINSKAIQDANKELKELELTIDNSKFDTIFGEDKWGKIAEAGDKWRMAAQEWEKVSQITFDEFFEDIKNGGVAGVDALAQTFANSQSVSLGNMWVQAKGVGKKKNSGYLQNLFPDIFDENGNLRRDKLEQAKVVLESLRSMKLADDSVIKALEENIGIAEKMNEAADALKEAASDYLGTIAQDLGNIIVDSILKGEDALEQLGDVGAEIITQLGRDLAQTWLINNYLKQFEEPIQEAFKNGDQKAVANIVADIVSGFPAMLEAGQQLVRGIFDVTKGTEYDVYEYAKEKEQQQKASQKGYEALSEETGSELSGRALAQYESTLRVEASLLDMKSNMVTMALAQQHTNFIAEDCRRLIAQSYIELQAIRENTDAMVSPIKNLSDKIDKWDSKIMEL